MNQITMYTIIGIALVALLVGAGIYFFRRRELRTSKGERLHPLLILGIIFLFPGLLNLITDGEESVFLSMGIIFTISGVAAQLLIRTRPGDQARRYGLMGSLFGFTIGAAAGAGISLVWGWPLILMIVVLGALGLLVGLLLGNLYWRRIQT